MASLENVESITLLRSSAAERNKDHILEVVRQHIPAGNVKALEIASGTGQHTAHFAEALPTVVWQPSECNKQSMHSIAGYLHVTHRDNLQEPVWINVTEVPDQWAGGVLSPQSFDLLLCVNMVHISEWLASEGLFRGCGYYLKPQGFLALYGPFKIHGEIIPESNVQFDQMLRQQNSEWGLRDIDDLENLAKANGLFLEKIVDVPANNKILIFRKS